MSTTTTASGITIPGTRSAFLDPIGSRDQGQGVISAGRAGFG